MTTNYFHKDTAITTILILVGILALAFIGATYREPNPAKIGGTEVSGLRCEEDEVIGFDGEPDALVCIHIDDLRGIAPLSADAAVQGAAEDAYDMGYAEGYEEGSIAAN